jgi:hypothetical protein
VFRIKYLFRKISGVPLMERRPYFFRQTNWNLEHYGIKISHFVLFWSKLVFLCGTGVVDIAKRSCVSITVAGKCWHAGTTELKITIFSTRTSEQTERNMTWDPQRETRKTWMKLLEFDPTSETPNQHRIFQKKISSVSHHGRRRQSTPAL